MDMDCSQLTQHIQKLVDKKTVAVFAKEIGVSRQTVYGLLAGNWPTQRVMEKLGIRLIWKKSKEKAQ